MTEQVTPEMLEAGCAALAMQLKTDTDADIVKEIYLAMQQARAAKAEQVTPAFSCNCCDAAFCQAAAMQQASPVSTELVERVSRALARHVDGREDHWEDYKPEAIAALTAIPLPQEGEVERIEQIAAIITFFKHKSSFEIAQKIDAHLTTSPDTRLREALWLFREFVIRNATQWQVGAGHHHPIWVMIAELIGEMGGIISGPFYRFVQADNKETLDALLATPSKEEE